MAGKPTVTLTLAGDEKKLTKAFDAVGDASKGMVRDLDKASDEFKRTGRSVEDFAEKSDTVDTRAMGFRDTITGLQDSFKGLTDSSLSTGDRLLTLGMGVGDLASGFTNLLIPALGKFGGWLKATTVGTWALTAAQTTWNAITTAGATVMRVLNTVMRANPILFIVGLIATLIGAFVLLWNKSAAFRNFWRGVWEVVKNVVGVAGRVLGKIWDGMKAAIQAVGDAVGWVTDRVKDAIGWFNDLIGKANNPKLSGGGGLTAPLRHHAGGTVPGMPGEEVLAVLQGGEHVNTSSQGGGGGTIVFGGNTDSAFASAFRKLVRDGVITLA